MLVGVDTARFRPRCRCSGLSHGCGHAVLQGPPLREHGLELISPEASVAHPFDDGSAAVIYRDLGRAIEELGDDGPRYRWFLEPILHRWDLLVEDLLSPMRVPVHPAALAVFGLRVGLPVTVLGRALFMTEKARGLLAGLASHSILPLWHPLSTAFAAIMAVTCHRPGWPIARGGAGRLAMALSSYLVSLGGEVITSRTVQGLGDIEPAQAVFFDVAPSHAVAIAGGGSGLVMVRGSGVFARGRGRSRWTGPSTVPSRGRHGNAGWPPRSTSAGPWTRSPRPRATCGGVGARKSPSCSWYSRACSIRRAPLRGSTRPGPTVTFRTVRIST